MTSPARAALNRVKGMGFGWSLNPYMGCAHQCTFCYVRAFERRADRPSDDRYGDVDPGQDQRRRRTAAGAGAQVVEARAGGDRRGDGSVPAGGGSLEADPRLPGSAGGAPQRRSASSPAVR